jgi:hypothetical protein
MTRSRGTRRRNRFLSTTMPVNFTGESDRSKAYDDPNRRTFRYRYRINGPQPTPVKTTTIDDLPHDSVLRR